MLRGKLTILVTQVFPEFAVKLSGIDKLYLAFAILGFVVAQNPDIGGNPSIVKEVVGQLYNGFEPIIFDDIAADIAFAPSCIPGKETGSVVYGSNTGTHGTLVERFHLVHHLH